MGKMFPLLSKGVVRVFPNMSILYQINTNIAIVFAIFWITGLE